MLKSHEYFFSLLQKSADLLAILLSWWLAYTLRFAIIPGGQQGLAEVFFKIFLVLLLLTLYSFHKHQLYQSQRLNSHNREILTVFKANTLAIGAFILLLYFFIPEKISRMMLLQYFVISQVSLISLRLIVRHFLRYLRKQGHNLRHILLVGHGEQIAQYVEAVNRHQDAGIHFIGWIDSRGMAEKYKIPTIEKDLEQVKRERHPDAVVIGYQGENFSQVHQLLKKSFNDVIPIQVLLDITYDFVGHQITDFDGLPMIVHNQPHISPLERFCKRSFDLIASGIGLLIISPLLTAIALMVKITSRGPIFYGQERMGLDGRCFKMWKFRSMRIDAETQTGAVWCVENDPRRTPIGKFLRESSLDELPQLWNVFNGDMSLVGPRPERPVFVEKFRDEIPVYMLRHKMKAGITGWAQINGWRGNTSLEKRIECDIYYIKNWTLWLDIKILFMTFWKGFFNKNAY